MPSKSESNCRVADSSTDEPDDHNGLEFLELLKFWDVVNGDSRAHSADCRDKSQSDGKRRYQKRHIHTDAKAVTTMTETIHKLFVRTFTLHAKKS